MHKLFVPRSPNIEMKVMFLCKMRMNDINYKLSDDASFFVVNYRRKKRKWVHWHAKMKAKSGLG